MYRAKLQNATSLLRFYSFHFFFPPICSFYFSELAKQEAEAKALENKAKEAEAAAQEIERKRRDAEEEKKRYEREALDQKKQSAEQVSRVILYIGTVEFVASGKLSFTMCSCI